MASYDCKPECREAQQYLYDFISGGEGIAEDAYNHIQACEHCQAESQRLAEHLATDEKVTEAELTARAQVIENLKQHFKYIDKEVSCQTVKPFLATLALPELRPTILTPLTAHIEQCGACLEDLARLQALQLSTAQLQRLAELFAESIEPDSARCTPAERDIEAIVDMSFETDPPKAHTARVQRGIIGSIARRASSNVVTRFRVDESCRSSALADSPEGGRNWPVEVEVVRRHDDVDDDEWEADGRKSSAGAYLGVLGRRVMKPFAAAAIIAVVLSLMLRTSPAGAVGLDELYKALAKVANVCITRFDPESPEPVQTDWISRPLGVRLVVTPEQVALWDINNLISKINNLQDSSISSSPMAPEAAERIKDNMAGSLGLLPFARLADIPEDAHWEHRTDGIAKDVKPDVQVYDLTWIDATVDGSVHWRCSVFVNTRTSLPEKIEYRSSYDAREYMLDSVRKVHYPNVAEIQRAIGDAGFQAL